jgi:hypothetical protein
MSQVIRVIPREDFELEVELDTGEKLVVDVKPLLVKPIFLPLKDETVFRQVRVDDFGGLEWPNGADICVDWILAQTTHRESRAGAA